MALASAGTVTAVPGSPMSAGASPVRTKCTSIGGVSFILKARRSGLVLAEVDVRQHVGLGGALPAHDPELVLLQDLALDPWLPELRDRGVPEERGGRVPGQDVLSLTVGGAPVGVARGGVGGGHQLVVLRVL